MEVLFVVLVFGFFGKEVFWDMIEDGVWRGFSEMIWLLNVG